MVRVVCSLILYSKDKCVLLQHRDGNAPTFPNYWSLFGGSVETGETLDMAVRRETMEELSYRLKNPVLLLSGEMSGETAGDKIHIFAEKYDGKTKLVQHEGDDMRWFKFSELDDIKMIPHDKKFLLSLKKKIYAFCRQEM